jgi:hypothetical protein
MPPVDVATPAAKRSRGSSKIKLELANAAANAALGDPMPKYHWLSSKPSTTSD